MFILKKVLNKGSKKIYSSSSYYKIINRIKNEILKSKDEVLFEVFGKNNFYEFYKNGELIFRYNEALDVSPFRGTKRSKFKKGEIVQILDYLSKSIKIGIICEEPLKPNELNPKLKYDYTDNVYLVVYADGDHAHPFEFQINEPEIKIKKQLVNSLNRQHEIHQKSVSK